MTIPVIFKLEGEVGFRDREAAILGEFVGYATAILATGGGAILRPANREHLRRNGSVRFLHPTPDTLWGRTRRSKHRPLLQVLDPRARLNEFYTFPRSDLSRVADFVVESDQEQVMRLAQHLEQQRRAAAPA